MKIIRWQLKLGITKQEFWIALYILSLLTIGSFVTYCLESIFGDHEIMNTLSASTVFVLHSSYYPYPALFVVIIPLIVPMALSDSIFTETLRNTNTVLYTRISCVKYMISKAVSCFILSLLIVIIPLAMSQILSLIAFPLTSFRPFTSNPSSSMGFANAFCMISLNKLYFEHPYIYNAVYSFVLALYAGVCSVFALAISLYIKKHRSAAISSVFILIVLSMLVGHYLRVSGHAPNKSLVLIDYFIIANDMPKYEIWNILIILAATMLLSMTSILHNGLVKDHL